VYVKSNDLSGELCFNTYPGCEPTSAASSPMNVPSSACDPGLMKSMYLLVSANLSGSKVITEQVGLAISRGDFVVEETQSCFQ
jgi:hypothetical protein